jgi:hypothetical protein
MSDTYRVNTSLTTSAKIAALNEMIMLLEGKIDQAKFNIQEINELYSGAGFDRKYLRDVSIGHTVATYGNWTHLKSEDGYSIWKIAPSDYAYASENNLYFDNKVLKNKGNATTEDAASFNLVYLYDGNAYINNSTEAASEAGTSFNLMNATTNYLYVGLNSIFKGIKIEFDTRGSNYAIETQIYHSGAGWVNLTPETDDYEDNTSNFESDGRINWSLASATGAGWIQNTVNAQIRYWARLKTTTIPVTTAKADYVIPADSVIGLLALSSEQATNEDWAWCTYSTNIYVTIRNTGATAYEGDYYIASSSSITNLENFFVYNHEYTLDHLDSNFNYLSGPTFNTLNVTSKVGVGTSAPNSKAILDLTSTTLTFLPPRLTTTQRNAIATPPEGATIYNTTTHRLNVCSGTGTGWYTI